MNNDIKITVDQRKTLEMALEFYIRLGLGQFSEIATRINLLHGERLDPDKLQRIAEICNELEELVWEDKPWGIEDKEVSLYTLNAFLLEAQLAENFDSVRWCNRRIRKKTASGEKIQ
jgi:hypothetical protein